MIANPRQTPRRHAVKAPQKNPTSSDRREYCRILESPFVRKLLGSILPFLQLSRSNADIAIQRDARSLGVCRLITLETGPMSIQALFKIDSLGSKSQTTVYEQLTLTTLDVNHSTASYESTNR